MPKVEKKETRGRQALELRAEAEGKFAGYIAVWGTVDSYRSSFVQGCFTKTIQERGNRIKVLDDHGKIIGKIDEIREDATGCYVEGSLTMGVERARDVYELMRSEAIDTLSFGFNTVKDKIIDGVRNILEVKLYEVSPVTFEANEAAKITSVRADDFSGTMKENELYRRGYVLTDSLHGTLSDIWWGDNTSAELLAKMDIALSQFHAAYLEWVTAFVDKFWVAGSEVHSMPIDNEVAAEFRTALNGRSLEAVAAETSFTVTELELLKRGKLLKLEAATKLAELSQSLMTAHSMQRRSKFEDVCKELRENGLTTAEHKRLKALFEIRSEEPAHVPEPANPLTSVMDALNKLTL